MSETEKGFGTGLRAQLERKQKGGDPAAEPALAGATRLPEGLTSATALPALEGAAAAEIEAMRKELRAGAAREQELRRALTGRLDAVPAAAHGPGLAEREAELAQKAAQISAAGDELDEREQIGRASCRERV